MVKEAVSIFGWQHAEVKSTEKKQPSARHETINF